MQKRAGADWVGHVLWDVVAFLAENEMMQSAQMLAVAAAHIEHDMIKPSPVPHPIVASASNVVMFPRQRRRLV
jgi:hypothetical protein